MMTRLMLILGASLMMGCHVSPVRRVAELPDGFELAAPRAVSAAASAAWTVQVTRDGDLLVTDARAQPGCVIELHALGAVSVWDQTLSFITTDRRSIRYDLGRCEVESQNEVPSDIEEAILWSDDGGLFVARQGFSRVVYTADGEMAGVVDGRPRALTFSADRDELAWVNDKGCALLWDIGGELSEVECGVSWVGFGAQGVVTTVGEFVHVWRGSERVARCPVSGKVLAALGDLWITEVHGEFVARSLVTCTEKWRMSAPFLVEQVFRAGRRVGFLGSGKIVFRR